MSAIICILTKNYQTSIYGLYHDNPCQNLVNGPNLTTLSCWFYSERSEV